MIPILTDLRNAYEAHDRDAFERHLKRLEEMLRYTGPIRQREDSSIVMMCGQHDVPLPCMYCKPSETAHHPV